MIQSGVNVGSAGHLAYIPGSNLYASALADYLAGSPTGTPVCTSPARGGPRAHTSKVDGGLLGYPAASAGDLTSGGSIANLVGIVTAREAHGLKAKDFDRAVVYLGEQTHHAIDKALRIAGSRSRSSVSFPSTAGIACGQNWKQRSKATRRRACVPG